MFMTTKGSAAAPKTERRVHELGPQGRNEQQLAGRGRLNGGFQLGLYLGTDACADRRRSVTGKAEDQAQIWGTLTENNTPSFGCRPHSLTLRKLDFFLSSSGP